MIRRTFLFLFLAVFATRSSASLEEAAVNMDTAVRTFVARRSQNGRWPLKNKKTGRVMQLQFESVDAPTVRALGDGLYAGVAKFTEDDGASVYAEFKADLSGGWEIKGMKLLTRAQAEAARNSAKREAVRALLSRAARHAGPEGSMPDVTLTTLGGGETSPADCPHVKCVTVYVAPWCPHCRGATNDILQMRDMLKAKDIDVRVIVGKDDAEKVRNYAETFGPGTMLDPDGAAEPPGGVPSFMVSDGGGGVLLRKAGAPEGQGGKVLSKYLEL